MTEVEQPQTNGIDIADDENNKARPADIEAVCDNAVLIVVLKWLINFFNSTGHA